MMKVKQNNKKLNIMQQLPLIYIICNMSVPLFIDKRSIEKKRIFHKMKAYMESSLRLNSLQISCLQEEYNLYKNLQHNLFSDDPIYDIFQSTKLYTDEYKKKIDERIKIQHEIVELDKNIGNN